jgi:hypothetical protein
MYNLGDKIKQLTIELIKLIPKQVDKYERIEILPSSRGLLILSVKKDEVDAISRMSGRSGFRGYRNDLTADIKDRILHAAKYEDIENILQMSQKVVAEMKLLRDNLANGRRGKEYKIGNGLFFKKVFQLCVGINFFQGSRLDYDLLHIMLMDVNEQTLAFGQINDSVISRKQYNDNIDHPIFEAEMVENLDSYFITSMNTKSLGNDFKKRMWISLKLSKERKPRKNEVNHEGQTNNSPNTSANNAVMVWLNKGKNNNNVANQESKNPFDKPEVKSVIKKSKDKDKAKTNKSNNKHKNLNEAKEQEVVANNSNEEKEVKGDDDSEGYAGLSEGEEN